MSQGPVTDAGKARSRRNALKHGLTGAGIVLPHEDEEAVDETFSALDDDLKPVGALESILVRRMALTSTRLDRLARQECAVLSLKSRESIGAYDRQVQNHVEQLGIRLLHDPVPRAGSLLPDRDHPAIRRWQVDEPNILVMELKETVEGCDYLIDRWTELEFMLGNDGYWWYDSKFKAIRMLGKRPETVLDDPEVGDIFTHNFALEPESEGQWATTCQHATWLAENRPMYHGRVAKLGERIPTDPGVARNFLYAIIDRELAALRKRREELLPLWELNRSEAPLRSAIDDTKQGELRRRYETANERELHKCIADFVKVRKMRDQEASGALDPGVGAPVTEPDKPPEPDSIKEVVSTDHGLSGSLRNEPEHSDTASLI